MEKRKHKNTRCQVYTTGDKRTKQEIYMRELDEDGKVISERRISVDAYNRAVGGAGMKPNYASSTEFSDGELTPSTSGRSTPQPLYATSRVDPASGGARNRQARDRDTWVQQQQEFCSYNVPGQTEPYSNGDDDLYDMPHETIPLSQLRQQKLERQRSLQRSQTMSSSQTSHPEMEQISSPIPRMFYHSSHQSAASSLGSRSRTASYSSSNNDFLEYERRLREDQYEFHRVNPTIPSKKSTNSSGDSHSTTSTNYPSLSFSPRDSFKSDGSWQGISSIASELATPSESDASTLDCESVIYRSDEESSLTDRSMPRAHAHRH